MKVKFESLIEKVSTLISIVGIVVMPLVLIAVIIFIHKVRKGGLMKTEEF